MSTSEWLLLGIVTFILIDFAAARVIDFLNESNKNVALTGVAAEIYNPNEYAKSLEYGTAKYKVEMYLVNNHCSNAFGDHFGLVCVARSGN